MRARFGNDGPESSQQESVDVSPIQAVFLAWRCFQTRPDSCKLTKARKRLIERALADYDADELMDLFSYAYTADKPGPRFWRGENQQGRKYLDLTNLLGNAARLSSRVEAATAWVEQCHSREPEMTEVESTAALAALARRAPGTGPSIIPAATTEPSQDGQVKPRRMARWGDDERVD